MISRRLSFLLACALGSWWIPLPTLPAQSLTRTLESLVRSTPQETEEQSSSASDQLPWAQEQSAESRTRRDLLSSEAFRERLVEAQYPESSRPDFLRQAQLALDDWGNSVIVLENIIARETVHGTTPEPVQSPQNSEEALGLDKELGTFRERLVQLDFEKQAFSENLQNATQKLRLAQSNLRSIQNALPAPNGGLTTEREDLDLLLAQTTLHAAQGSVFYQKWNQYRQSLETDRLQGQVAAIEKAIGDTGFRRILQTSRAREQIEHLRASLVELEKMEEKTVEAFEAVTQEASTLRAKLAEIPPEESENEKLQRAQLQTLLAVFDEHDLLRTAARARTQFNHQAEGLWSRVLDLLADPTLINLKNARESTENEQTELQAAHSRLDRGLSDARSRSERLSAQLADRGLPASERALLDRQQKTNAQAIEQLQALKSELTQLATAQSRLLEELDAEIARGTAAESFHALALGLWNQFQSIWNYPILEQGDRHLTLGLIVTAILALIFALVTARFLARRLCLTLQSRFRLVPSQADLIEKITLYITSVILVLMVLQWLQIPLTVFAFLGGALAVGLSFGSQNLINNFISGLILLQERKISVGDLVEVDGNFGRVTSLGSRCSGILKFDGVEVLVPNSSLLEKNVINWTLSDPQHRYDWVVGVAYGSDVDLVFSTLYEVLNQQPELLKDPAPEVAFENFGDSTLDFHVYYWIEIGSCNARQVGSEMRRKIDRLFRQRNIEIAFPQQDVHLKIERPIPISAPSPTGPTPS